MDHCARLVQAASAASRPRTEHPAANLPVYRRAAVSLEELSSRVVRDPDTVEAMAKLVDDRSRIEPAGALIFACLLHLSDRSEGAQFWWQSAAGAGMATAAYCLYLHHAQYSEEDRAHFWYGQALALHHDSGGDLYPQIATEPPTPLSGTLYTPENVGELASASAQPPREQAIEQAAGVGGMLNWALDHVEIADAVCRLQAATDEEHGLVVPPPDPALASELEEHMAAR